MQLAAGKTVEFNSWTVSNVSSDAVANWVILSFLPQKKICFIIFNNSCENLKSQELNVIILVKNRSTDLSITM